MNTTTEKKWFDPMHPDLTLSDHELMHLYTTNVYGVAQEIWAYEQYIGKLKYPERYRRQAMRRFYRHVQRLRTCEAEGHDWEEDAYCNPERGYIGMTCRRCNAYDCQGIF